MKNFSFFTLLLVVVSGNAQPTAFYKNCLVTSVTRGPSAARYSTWNHEGKKQHSQITQGYIDPLIMEYGITNRIGAGFTKGGEFFEVNVNDFYGADLAASSQFMEASTNYLTLDFSYHPLVTKRTDISLFVSGGSYKISGNVYQYQANQTMDQGKVLFNYNAKGTVVRAGTRVRWYFSRRFGLMSMVYVFNGNTKEKQKPNPISDAPNKSGYRTMLTGGGLEFGLCFRLFKQKGVKEESPGKCRKEKSPRHTRKEANKDDEEENEKVPLIQIIWD